MLQLLCNDASNIVSLITMELCKNGVATHFKVTPLISMRTVSLALMQSCRGVDADAWCKRALSYASSVPTFPTMNVDKTELNMSMHFEFQSAF